MNDRVPETAMVLMWLTFLLLALTGRCSCIGCGFDRDYIGEAVSHTEAR